MNAKEVKLAWENDLPVTICKPNEAPIECEKIIEVIYWKQNGRKRVSCVCVDRFGNKYRARQIDIKIRDGVQIPKTPKPKKTTLNDIYENIISLWAKHCPMLPQPKLMTDTRRKLINKSVEDNIDFEELFTKVANSDFLTKEWNKCNFDWCLKLSNRVKILEGNYDNKDEVTTHDHEASYDIEELERICSAPNF